MKNVFVVIVMILIGVLFVAGASYALYFSYAFYAPKYEQVRRETFETSRAFREGTIRDMENLALEYARANDTQKEAIKTVARHRLANIPNDLMTPSLIMFKREIEKVN
jgi:hypothetical protein